MNLLTLADQQFQQGQLKEAMATYQQALKQQPQNAEVYFAFGQFMRYFQNDDMAEKLLQFGLKLNPNHVDGLHVLAQLYKALQRDDEAQALFERANGLPHTARHKLSYALFLEYKADPRADALYQETLAADPNQADTVFFYSRFLFRTAAEFDKAISFLEGQVARFPDYPELVEFLASLYFRQNEYAKLQALAQQNNLSPMAHIAAQAWYALWRLQNEHQGVPAEVSTEIKPEYRDQDAFSRLRPIIIFRLLLGFIYAYDQAHKTPRGQTKNPLFMVGDSHCMAPAGLLLNQGHAHVESRMVPGTKMFHLVQDKGFVFKEAFRKVVYSLPEKAQVVFTVGEIDCRPDEGFLPYFKKHPQVNKEQHIEDTAHKGVAFLAQLCRDKQLKGALWGVPMAKMHAASNAEEAAEINRMILVFNRALAQACAAEGLTFIDVHRVTAQADGTISLEAYLDICHLQPWVYQQLLPPLLEQA